jgi:glycosyltransferase involved in cell wall biosynthesis
MKILLFRDYNMFAELGASANRWRTLVEGLSKFDVDIFILITSGYKSYEERIKYGRKGFINEKTQYLYSTNQKHYNYWVSRINIYILSDLYLIYNVRNSKDVINQFRPDIVFICPSLDVFRIISRILQKNTPNFKLMMEINEFNDISDKHATNKLQEILNSRFNYFLSKEIFPRLDFCLVITECLKNYYSQFPDINPDISFFKVPMTVDINRFKKIEVKCNLKKPYIAYCGTSSFYKDGVDILLKSFEKISNEYPKLKLFIAAFWEKDGPKMMRLIEDIKLGDKIIYLGILDRETIPAFLKDASVLALPRPDTRQAQGGFPTKLGEYLSTGNAVCVTNVGEISDYLVDNESAFLADPGVIDSFSDALRRALFDRKNARRVGKNGKKVAEIHFNQDVQAQRLFNFLKENAIK